VGVFTLLNIIKPFVFVGQRIMHDLEFAFIKVDTIFTIIQQSKPISDKFFYHQMIQFDLEFMKIIIST